MRDELKKIGGLCGLCSRDLPLDRRVLFMAELTGRRGDWEKCRVQVMLLVDPEGFWFYRPIRVFNELPRRWEIGCGTWSRTTMGKLMRLSRFSTFPRLK